MKVLLLEINEITWDLIDPFLERGKLPTFSKLKNSGAFASPISVDLAPQLDPWITWTTVYTGQAQSEHNVFHLQQPPESIKAARIWEICRDAGLKVGVYGSLCSYPPQKVEGFYIPDTFSPTYETFPSELSPIQKLNLTYTRSIRLQEDEDGLFFKLNLAKDLVGLGLRPATCLQIIKQLATERFAPTKRWQRVALQPAVNFDFFSKLYAKSRPDFASFHTNHVAHFQHTYWKAMQPELFPQATTDAEKSIYGNAIEYGYASADALISRALELCDEETTLVIASSMGQKAYISDLEQGKQIGQIRSLDRLMEILGLTGRVKVLSTMSDQFNLYPESESIGAIAKQKLGSAFVETNEKPLFYVSALDNFLTVNLRHYDGIDEDTEIVFPDGDESLVFRYEDIVYQTGHSKSGCHDPKGMLIMHGPKIRQGELQNMTNLDIAPTILKILGLPIPTAMKGRVAEEALL